MKKQLMSLAFVGLFVNPCCNIIAGRIDKEDLQKMSANSMENQAWRNAQDIVGSLAFLGLICTGASGINACIACNKRSGRDATAAADVFLFTTGTAVSATITTGLCAGWYKIFKKRAIRHGYGKKLVEFFFVDWMSRLHEQ